MAKHLTLLTFLALSTLAVGAPFANDAYRPPVEGKNAEATQAEITAYLDHVDQIHTFQAYQGLNEYLKTANEDPQLLRASEGLPLEMTAEELFGEGFSDGGYNVWVAGIASVDACALRLLVDLSGLEVDEELWLIDPTGPRAFGPYAAYDQLPDGRWLPTVSGDTAVLAVRSTAAQAPDVTVAALSHFYRGLEETAKLLSCNINIACETTAAILEISSGVGMMVVPIGGGDYAICTGTLINNEDTAAFEPYFITSNHCVPGAYSATDIDVIWDYRAVTCGADDAPSIATLPRSSGVSLLATDSMLDITLLKLDSVSVGSYGRFYVGWDTRTPVVDEDVICIEHPEGSHMRIAYGRVQTLNVGGGGYWKQTRMVWDAGVTEPGSSGSGVFFADGTYRLFGTLSNGTSHVCGPDRSGNIDNFSSLRDFYPTIEDWLTGTNPPNGTGNTSLCPASVAFKGNEEVLKELRAFRDEVLAPSEAGFYCVVAYYGAAPRLADVVERSALARGAFMAAAYPVACVGSWFVDE